MIFITLIVRKIVVNNRLSKHQLDASKKVPDLLMVLQAKRMLQNFTADKLLPELIEVLYKHGVITDTFNYIHLETLKGYQVTPFVQERRQDAHTQAFSIEIFV